MARRPLNDEPVSRLAAWSSRLAIFALAVAEPSPRKTIKEGNPAGMLVTISSLFFNTRGLR